MKPLLEKMNIDVRRLLGTQIRGEIGYTVILLTRDAHPVVLQPGQSVTLRDKDAEIYRIDMTVRRFKMQGNPNSINSAYSFAMELDIYYKVVDPEKVLQYPDAETMLRGQIAQIARDTAYNHTIEDYRVVEEKIRQRVLATNFHSIGLELTQVNLKIRLGPEEVEALKKQREREREGDADIHQRHIDNQLATMDQEAEFEKHRKLTDFLQEQMGKGFAGQVTLQLMDGDKTISEAIDIVMQHNEVEMERRLKIMQFMVKEGLIEPHETGGTSVTLFNTLAEGLIGSGRQDTNRQISAHSSASGKKENEASPFLADSEPVYDFDPNSAKTIQGSSFESFNIEDDEFDNRATGQSILVDSEIGSDTRDEAIDEDLEQGPHLDTNEELILDDEDE